MAKQRDRAVVRDDTTVIEEFVEMCVSGDEHKWSPTRWARMMELALRRIATT